MYLTTLLAAVLLVLPTALWYKFAPIPFASWGTVTTSTLNTVQLVLLLLVAKDNPLWLPVNVVGKALVDSVLERYGYKVGYDKVVVIEGDIFEDANEQV